MSKPTNDLEELEALRKKLRVNYFIEKTASVISFVSFLLFIVVMINDKNDVLLGFLTFGFMIISFLIIFYGKSHEFFDTFNKKIIKPFIVKKLNGNFKDNNNEEIKKIFCQVEDHEYPFVKDDGYKFFSYNVFEHQYNKVPILSSTIRFNRYLRKNNRIIFEGTFISIETPLNLNDVIEIQTSNIQSSYELENKEFMDNYSVHGSSLNSISFLLSPVVMENLSNLLKDINIKFRIKFFSNNMYIFIEEYNMHESNSTVIENKLSKDIIENEQNYILDKIDDIHKIIDCFEFSSSSIKKSSNLTKNTKTLKVDSEEKNIDSISNHKLDDEDIQIKNDNKGYVYNKFYYHHIFFGNIKNPNVMGRLFMMGIALFLFILVNAKELSNKNFFHIIEDRVVLLFMHSDKEINNISELKDLYIGDVIKINHAGICEKIVSHYSDKCHNIKIKDNNDSFLLHFYEDYLELNESIKTTKKPIVLEDNRFRFYDINKTDEIYYIHVDNINLDYSIKNLISIFFLILISTSIIGIFIKIFNSDDNNG
jgi:hypothetical protein